MFMCSFFCFFFIALFTTNKSCVIISEFYLCRSSSPRSLVSPSGLGKCMLRWDRRGDWYRTVSQCSTSQRRDPFKHGWTDKTRELMLHVVYIARPQCFFLCIYSIEIMITHQKNGFLWLCNVHDTVWNFRCGGSVQVMCKWDTRSVYATLYRLAWALE